MPALTRPDGQIHGQVHVAGFPALLFAPGGPHARPQMRPTPAHLPDGHAAGMAGFGRNIWQDDVVFGVSRDFARTCAVSTLLPPGAAVLTDWRGPANLAEPEARVAAFLQRHTPQA